MKALRRRAILATMSDPILSRVEIAAGKLTPQRASLFCGVPDCLPAHGWSLSGKVTGPRSILGATLPAAFELRDLGPGPSVLAQADVLEPVYWSPEIPAIYRLELELRRHGSVVEQMNHLYGIRWLDIRGGAFAWQGRRTILRGSVGQADVGDSELTSCLPNPDFADCLASQASGATILAEWSHSNRPLAECVREWSKSPAVIAVLVPADESIDRSELPPAPQAFLAADLRHQDEFSIPGWADVIALRDDQIATLVKLESSSQPELRPVLVFAERPSMPLRDACDRLRAELAPLRQCAGYFVS